MITLTSQTASLRQQLWARIRHRWILKNTLTTLFITVFFVTYFYLLRNPQNAVFVMPSLWLDRALPFTPSALILYLSLWLYVVAPCHLTRGFAQFLALGTQFFLLCGVGLLCFWLWPTATPPAHISWADYPGFTFLQRIDAAGNACPSLHVATAVYAGIWLEWLLKHLKAKTWQRGVNALWCLGIVWSTLATRQHVSLDVVAGFALAIVFALLFQSSRARLL